MSSRFPYNMSSRAALVELVRETEGKPNLRDDLVSFEDLFFIPTELEPGRTYIEITDLTTGLKRPFDFRRLDLASPRCLGPSIKIQIQVDPTPASIAAEINRSRRMNFDSGDVSFSTELIQYVGSSFIYDFTALSGSYAYYGTTKVEVEVIPTSKWTRYKENSAIRYTEIGIERETEHTVKQWEVA